MLRVALTVIEMSILVGLVIKSIIKCFMNSLSFSKLRTINKYLRNNYSSKSDKTIVLTIDVIHTNSNHSSTGLIELNRENVFDMIYSGTDGYKLVLNPKDKKNKIEFLIGSNLHRKILVDTLKQFSVALEEILENKREDNHIRIIVFNTNEMEGAFHSVN